MADGGPGGPGGGSGPWWKSFTPGARKKGKEAGGGGSAGPQGAPSPAPPPDPREPSPPGQAGLPGPAEPPRPDRLGDEKLRSSRRHLKISRSGRFKEKRKVRATLLPDGPRAQDDSDLPCAPREERQ
ncbi:proline-rich protein 15 [Macrotis lagotis]|uniref:proline-rich protein 15 n=1 Tax=Macrotis lagotis TaxID=92651 RepID=UPI003D68D516